MTSKQNLTSLFTGLFLLSPLISLCQELPTTKTFTPQDTVTLVEILPGVRKLEYRKIDSVTEIQILAGNVRLKQGNTIFSCDSCVINKRLNLFEAFGNVHINDSDTADVYSDHLRYLTDKRIAYLTNNVKLTDGKGVLTTKNLEYDVNTKVGIYKKGGKVVSKSTVVTSDEGYYYADLKDVYFKKNVRLKDPKYELESDSLLYNTEFETARFIAETFIKDSSNRTIKTREGYYNQQTGIAEFGKRPVVQDGAIQATGDKMYSDDATGITQITGRAILIDTSSDRTVFADEIFFNNKTESFLATKKPLMIIKQENDSIFITADTLFSAKLSDLYSKKESTKQMDTVMVQKTDDKMNIDNKKSEVPDSLHSSSSDISKNKNANTGKKDVLQEIKPTDLKTRDSVNFISADAQISTGRLTEQNKKKDATVNTGVIPEIKPADSKTRDSAISTSASSQISPLLMESNKKTDTTTKNNVFKEIKTFDSKTGDSTNLASADSLLSEQNKVKDFSEKKDTLIEVKVIEINTKDSTNRYFEAFRNVRIFSDSLQAVCDSMFYSFKDSVFRLYDNPIVWSKESQITGDTILLYTKNKKADKMEILRNSFIASLVASDIFNQVRSARMDAYFKEGSIDSVRANGKAESIYFIQDEDSAFTGINQSTSDLMDIFFRNRELERVVFRGQVKGTIWPMQAKTPLEMRLPNFKWQDERRPKSRFELYE